MTRTWLVTALVCDVLFAVAPAPASRADGIPAPAVGLPNPASVFCVRHGGTLSLVSDDRGNQHGLCTLPDGRVIEEWRLFRCSHPRTADQERPPCQGEGLPPDPDGEAPSGSG